VGVLGAGIAGALTAGVVDGCVAGLLDSLIVWLAADEVHYTRGPMVLLAATSNRPKRWPLRPFQFRSKAIRQSAAHGKIPSKSRFLP
jgi:hypothetical protein